LIPFFKELKPGEQEKGGEGEKEGSKGESKKEKDDQVSNEYGLLMVVDREECGKL
jgi:hypothetical protein